MGILIAILTLAIGSAGAVSANPAVAQSTFVLQVDGPGGHGTLAFSDERVMFAGAPGKSRTWMYEDLKEVRVESPTRIVFTLYEGGSRLRFGHRGRVTFTVTPGRVDGDLVAYLLHRIPRPTMSAVKPAGLGDVVAQVPVKHNRHGRGQMGMLQLYDGGLAFDAPRAADSRYWRARDIQSVARVSPFELLVTVYDSDSTRPFDFTLRAEMSADVFDALWAQVNPPVVRAGGVTSGGSPAIDREPSSGPPPAPMAVREEPSTQRISLEITEAGFVPLRFEVETGRPVELVVTRTTDKTCGTEIVIGNGSQRADLPLNEPVTLKLGPLAKGELKISCGMAMLKGTVVAR